MLDLRTSVRFEMVPLESFDLSFFAYRANALAIRRKGNKNKSVLIIYLADGTARSGDHPLMG